MKHVPPDSIGWRTTLLVAVMASLCSAILPAQNQVCTHLYTTDADFDLGTLVNVNHSISNQLQLNATTSPFPFINVACSNLGTVVRIDVNTGTILGEYLTAPAGMQTDPSRTTVDQFGNVWVANRNEAGWVGAAQKGSVTRIALVIGGTRCNQFGVPVANGQYLKPPFQYSTAIDRDGDGLIKTSTGLGNVLPWTNADVNPFDGIGDDTYGGVSTADDECIINYVRTAGKNARTLAIDANNDLWVGGYGNLVHEKIDGGTGVPVAGTSFNANCGGYGGLVDGAGVLWSANIGLGSLLRYDPVVGPPGQCIGVNASYGLAVDGFGNIWNCNFTVPGTITELNPAGAFLGIFGTGGNTPRGVAVTSADNNIWIANSGSATVARLTNAGVMVAGYPIGVGNTPTGVAVDANGKVWVTNFGSNNVMRIDPATNLVDLTVVLGVNAGPYNYSDMTGNVALGATMPSGNWTVIHDGVDLGTTWGTVSWNSLEPAGTRVRVYIRAADQQINLPAQPWLEVQNGVTICRLPAMIAGRFLEVRTVLSRTVLGTTPILYDLSVQCCNRPPVAICQNITVNVTQNCMASVVPAQIDNGSFDPDGDPITLALDASGPWPEGTYNVVLSVTDSHGATSTCPATVAVVATYPNPTITVTPSPTVSPGGDPNTIYIGYGPQTVNLAVSEGVAWNWTSDPSGFTSSLQNPDVSPTATTKYTVEVTNEVGCKTSVDVTIVVCDIRCGNNLDKVTICHNADKQTNTLCIAPSAVPAHLTLHGDHLGPCPILKDDQATAGIPDKPSLLQNTPNPFDGSTVIAYTLPEETNVNVTVTDLLGSEVARLVSCRQSAGMYNVLFDAHGLARGTYIYRLETDAAVIVRLMTIIR